MKVLLDIDMLSELARGFAFQRLFEDHAAHPSQLTVETVMKDGKFVGLQVGCEPRTFESSLNCEENIVSAPVMAVPPAKSEPMALQAVSAPAEVKVEVLPPESPKK